MKLEELKELCERATAGPWGLWLVTTAPQTCPDGEERPLVHGAAPPHEMRSDLEVALEGSPNAVDRAQNDMCFIAAARTYMPKLITIAKFAALYLDKGTLAHQHCLQGALEALEKE